MNSEKQFEAIVDSVSDCELPSDQHRQRLRQQVLDAMESDSPATSAQQTKQRTFSMRKRVIGWTAAAAAVALCAVGVWHLTNGSPGTGLSPKAAWADVQKAVSALQSVTMQVDVYDGDKLVRQESHAYMDGKKMRVESDNTVAIIDLAAAKVLVLVAEGKQAYTTTAKDAKHKQTDWVAHLKGVVGSKDAKEVGTEVFDKRQCKGWQVEGDGGTLTVWADEKTAQLVRVEIKQGPVRTVMKNFDFSPKLDESKFSMDVPQGYKLAVEADVTATQPAGDGLELLLRAWAGGNGGVFPDSLLDLADWSKAADKYDWSQEKLDEPAVKKAISGVFFRLHAGRNWVYRGKGVKLGDAKTPIFWAPAGKDTYRVIYGDLKSKEVRTKDLPATAPATATARSVNNQERS